MDGIKILVPNRSWMMGSSPIRVQALRGPAPDEGLWNGRSFADKLRELIGEPISRQQGWEYLFSVAITTASPAA